jgi:hypothetical protein
MGAEGCPSPTERRTAGENVVTPTVCEVLSSSREPPEPEPRAWRNASRASRSLTVVVVDSERIGSPIVTQRTATSGRASSTGSARERVRAMVRAEGSRRGRST